MRSPSDRITRVHAFVLLVVGCAVLATGFVAVEAVGSWTSSSGAAERAGAAAKVLSRASQVGVPYLVYRDLDAPDEHVELALVPVDRSRPAVRAGLGCSRVYMAAGNGLCLAFDVDPLPGYRAKLFGPDLRARSSLGLEGIPSRARVSPDGRYGAFTIFVTGHSYRALDFSTRTAIVDMETGRYVVRTLEDFSVTKDGERIHSRDFNFWGVTFAADGSRFYATLWTKRTAYLVEGTVESRHVRVLRENAECPSLSPDGTRLVYKKREGGHGAWRFHVLDLATGRETPLAETRSRDDQVEWLDDGRVAYGGDGKIWAVPADGSGRPEVLVDRGDSPVVVRTVS